MSSLASLFFALVAQVPQQAPPSAPSASQPTAIEQQAAELIATEPARAVELLRRAVAEQEAGSNDADTRARTLNSLAFALSKTGRHAEATSAGEQALALARGVKDPSEATTSIRRNLAEISDKADRLAAASAYAEAAVLDAEATWGKTPLAAEFREYAATLAQRLGRMKAAEEHLGWAIAIYEKILGKTMPDRVAGPSAMLANLLRNRGRRRTAWRLYDYAITSLERGGKAGSPMWRTLMETRSAALQEIGEYELAKQTMQRAMDAASQTGTASKQDWLRWTQRWLMLAEGKAARQTSEHAPPQNADPAERWMLQAQVALCEGRWQAALTACDQADTRLKAIADASGQAAGAPISVELTWLRATARIALGQHDASLEDLLEVLRIERQLWGEDSSRLLRTYAGLLRSELAKALANDGEPTPELIDFVDMFAASEQWLTPRTLATLHDRAWLAKEASMLESATEAWLMLAAGRPKHRAASFEAVDRLRQRTRASATATAIERANHSGLLGELFQLVARESETRKDDRPKLRQEFTQKLASLRIEAPGLANRIAPVGAKLSTVQQQLKARGQAMLQLSCASHRITAWWLTPAGEMRIVPLGKVDQLEPRIRQSLVLLQRGEEASLAELSARLLGPLWPELQTQPDVVVIADGCLKLLPFEALPQPDGKPWLQSTRISYACSATEWLQYRELDGDGAGVGHLQRGPGQTSNPQFARILGRLPAAGSQTGLALQRDIAKRDPKVRTERELRAAQRSGALQNLRLLEIETPAYIDASAPAATGILLGVEPQQQKPLWDRDDGWLDPAELRGASIEADVAAFWQAHCILPKSHDLDPRTAGLDELLAATFEAGARGVVMAGWPSSSRLSTSFENAVRSELLTDGDRRKALRRAQLAWLERAASNPKMRAPHVWARLRYWGR